MSVVVKALEPTGRNLRDYVHFGIDLYKGNDYFVPPLIIDEMATLDPKKNPAFDHCDAQMFMAYRDGQPFNGNHLRPCPMLENPAHLLHMVRETGAHSTDLQSPEAVEDLCGKCSAYAEAWRPVAERLWQENPHHVERYENYKKVYTQTKTEE